jgi:superkiller protein 3
LTEALDLDRSLADVHSGLAAIHMFNDWSWSEAERELNQAIAVDPNGMLTWNMLGFWQAAQDRLPEALASIRRGQALDPLAAARRNELAMCYNWMRRYQGAMAEAQKALELDRDFPLAYAELGLAYVQQGMCEKAIEDLTEALDHGHQHPRVKGMLGYAYAVARRRAEAQKVLEALEALAPKRFGFALPIARIYAALGEKAQALGWLQKARDERDSSVIRLKVDPTMDDLRKHPGFSQVLKDMGLPP